MGWLFFKIQEVKNMNLFLEPDPDTKINPTILKAIQEREKQEIQSLEERFKKRIQDFRKEGLPHPYRY